MDRRRFYKFLTQVGSVLMAVFMVFAMFSPIVIAEGTGKGETPAEETEILEEPAFEEEEEPTLEQEEEPALEEEEEPALEQEEEPALEQEEEPALEQEEEPVLEEEPEDEGETLKAASHTVKFYPSTTGIDTMTVNGVEGKDAGSGAPAEVTAETGSTVTVVVSPLRAYKMTELKYYPAAGGDPTQLTVEPAGGTYTFEMPDYDIVCNTTAEIMDAAVSNVHWVPMTEA